MNNIIYLISIALIILFSGTLRAQVVIGSGDKPAGYSLLQVDYVDSAFPNGGGLQLPRLDAAGKAALNTQIAANPTQAAGLTIYNTVNNKVECWDGSKWVPIPNIIEPVFNAQNGLTKTYNSSTQETSIRLGDTPLTENTTVALKGNTLTFTKNMAAVFGVMNNTNNPAVAVTQNRVGVGTSSPTAKLHIARSNGDNNYPFRLADGTQGSNFVLTSKDTEGNARWAQLPAKVETKSKYISTSISNLNAEKILSDTIHCTPGKWLIIGHYAARDLTQASKEYGMAKIKALTYSGSTITSAIDLAVAGAIAEPGGFQLAMPEVIYYGEFDTTTIIALYGRAPGTGSSFLSWGIGITATDNGYYGYLSAVKLADLDD